MFCEMETDSSCAIAEKVLSSISSPMERVLIPSFSKTTPIPSSLSFRTYSSVSLTLRANRETDFVTTRSICFSSHMVIIR